MTYADYLSVSEVAERLGAIPHDVSQMLYRRLVPVDRCPKIAGRRAIPVDMLDQIAEALKRSNRMVNGQKPESKRRRSDQRQLS